MKKDDFLLGMKDAVPIFLGYLAVSFAFGMNICQAGFPVWLAGLISATNLTSAGQFAGTQLILEKAPYISIIVTTIIINTRYFLMALAVSQKVDGSFNTFKRFSVAHGITDEISAVSLSKKGVLTPNYMFGLIILPMIGWTGGTVLGGVFSNILPDTLVNSMCLSLYAMFIAIVIPPAKRSKPIMITVIASAVLSVIFEYTLPETFISSGWGIIVIAIIVPAVMATVFPADVEEVGTETGKEGLDG